MSDPYDFYEEDYTVLEEELIHKIDLLEDQIATLEHENYELREELEYVQDLLERSKDHEFL